MKNIVRGETGKGSGVAPSYGRIAGQPAEAQRTQQFDDAAINSEAPPTTSTVAKATPAKDSIPSARGMPPVQTFDPIASPRADMRTLAGATPDSDKGTKDIKPPYLATYRTEAGETL